MTNINNIPSILW